jgi:hypothetical protein
MSYSPVQIALIALLPKDGSQVRVAELARAVSMTEWDVTEELREPWFDGFIDYSVQTDSFSAKRASDSTQERKKP